MTSKASIPSVPLWLGLGGLVPFVALAGAKVMDVEVVAGVPVHGALVAYALAILSFLGGIRWGLALTYENGGRAARDYVISIVPPLVGWASLALAAPSDLVALAIAFVLLGLLDYGLVCREDAPEWFGNLRLGLSGAVAVLLLVAAYA